MIESENAYWRRNLFVCMAGAFSTVFAMTLMLPFLPLYVEQLGVSGHAAVVQWSGIAYSATFLSAGLVAPIWGRLGDRYGRKAMLVRASLGMAVMVSLMGFATNIWHLIFLRLLAGLAGGYSSGATILIAVQAPEKRAGWALGMVASGVMAENLAGPLAGGWLPPLIGIRATFWLAGLLIFMAFLLTLLLIRESVRPVTEAAGAKKTDWSRLPGRAAVICMLTTGLLLMLANMSIEPIITVFIRTLSSDSVSVTHTAGLVMSAAALGSVISASWLGRVADRVGHVRIIVSALVAAAILLVPQAFVMAGWQLITLRFLMGFALGGLLPCIAAVIRRSVPEENAGSVMGYSVSAQFTGQFTGPLLGGFIGAHLGMRCVFLATSLLLLAGAALNWRVMMRSSVSPGG
ncbi:MFS transporter [Pseudescherichia sp.]|uniref:MFS transporter n=1 Tax=Pseudescherichia sp. TaxID=2055881 RepID=UPI0028A2B89F|nr:MFS transporter [Pseudescherichia sp.]